MRISLLVLLLAFAGRAGAQRPTDGSVAGSVRSDEGPLVGATVALYSGDMFVTGAAAGPDGSFQIEGVTPGTYRIRLSFLGYVSAERGEVVARSGETTDLGAVLLEADPAQLSGVEVTAERELVEQRADRTVYNVAAQPVTAGGSALDALQTLPSVEVDTDGNLSLRGGQNVAVHLNGRPVPVRGAQLAAFLRQISARDVERIEVIPNPSAQYEPDGMSGIINIVLKQNTDRGLSGGLTAGGGTRPSGQLGGNAAYQRGPWDVSASYGYRHDRSGLSGATTRVAYGVAGLEGDQTLDQTLAFDNGTRSHLVTGTLDYTVAEGTILGASGTAGLRDGTALQDVGYVFGAGTADESSSSRAANGDTGGLTGDVAVTARREVGEGHRMSAEARWTRNDDDRDERFVDLLAGGREVLTRSDVGDGVDETSVQADYVRPLGGVQVEAGVKGTDRDIDSSQEFYRGTGSTADAQISGQFAYQETVGAAYVQGSRTFGALQFQAGLRAETARREVTPDAGAAPTGNQYTSLYPSAFALYTISPGTSVKASTSRRVNRPQAFALNPTPRFQDTLLVDVGNPALRPEYTTAVELAVQYQYVLTVTPFYRHTTDVVRRRLTFDPATGITRGTFQNLDTQDSYGADVTYSPRFGVVRGLLSGSIYRSLTDGRSVENGLSSDGLLYTLRANVQAEVRPGTTVQMFGLYRGPQATEDGSMSAYRIVSMGLSHRLNERFRLSANLTDLLGTAEFSYETGTDEYRLVGVRRPNIRQAIATLSYTFGRQGPPRPQQPQPQGPGLDSVGV